MDNYSDLLIQKKEIDRKIYVERKILHHQFVKSHHQIFRFLDVLVVLIIFFNLLNLTFTNFMVAKNDYDSGIKTVVQEINPVSAKLHNFEVHEEAITLFSGLIKQAFLWSIIVFSYIYLRSVTSSRSMLWLLGFIVLFMIFMMGFDFFNNLGFVIGKIVFG